MWSRGDVVAVRELWRGRVWKARPWIVVEDGGDATVLWIPQGTPTKVPDGSGIPRGEWSLHDRAFGREALWLARRGALHSILVYRVEGEVEWYVNLERPLRRSRVGFDYLDRELDVVARPDGTWEWLDEDEFEEAQGLGVIDATEAALMRAEGEAVVAAWPFPTGWEQWRPDAAWPLPVLPDDWEDVPSPVLRTERLELRPLDESDLPWYAELRARDGFDYRMALHRHSEALEHWALHAFGKFAVLVGGEPAGIVTLNHTGEGVGGVEPHEIDLGWYTLPHLWGRGIAPEAAAAVVRWATEQEIGPLVVFLHHDNAASRRVAEKLGLRRDGDGRSRDGRPLEIYRVAD